MDPTFGSLGAFNIGRWLLVQLCAAHLGHLCFPIINHISTFICDTAHLLQYSPELSEWMDPHLGSLCALTLAIGYLVQLCAARLGSPLLPTYLSHFHIPVCDHQLIHRSPSYTMLSIFYATTTKCTLTNLNTRLNVFLFPEHQAETLCWDQLVR